MKSVEFLYWLNGWIEISDPKEITPNELNMIRNHLNLVKKYEEINKSIKNFDLSPYINSIEGIIKTDEIITNPGGLKLLKQILYLVFKHEVDPSYSSDQNIQDILNIEHFGPNGIFNGPHEDGIMRC